MFNLKNILKNKLLEFTKNNLGIGDNLLPDRETAVVERTLSMVRSEYTVMPRFGFHQPLDYYLDTLPVKFETPLKIDGEELPVPAPDDRMGYSPNDAEEYLRWGRDDKNLVKTQIDKHLNKTDDVSILDFGCSSGRVLRHFYAEAKLRNWTLSGVDIQAKPIQWMREFLPSTFCVYTGSTMPILPFPDNNFDVIYGFSIFTHIKFHWDMWLLELKRVLKPGGLLIQTIHTENAWRFYYDHRDVSWVANNHSATMLNARDMPYEYFYYGDMSVSQVFWKREVARAYWGRYFTVLDVMQPPDERSFQDWMICRKSVNTGDQA
jgi:ubiquinone/menaquinone biosynthesis C-methylase UbiE